MKTMTFKELNKLATQKSIGLALGVTQARVSQRVNANDLVTLDDAIAIEKAIGIHRTETRPDIFGTKPKTAD